MNDHIDPRIVLESGKVPSEDPSSRLAPSTTSRKRSGDNLELRKTIKKIRDADIGCSSESASLGGSGRNGGEHSGEQNARESLGDEGSDNGNGPPSPTASVST